VRLNFEDLGVPTSDSLAPYDNVRPGEIFVRRDMGSLDLLFSVPLRNVGAGIAVVSTPHPSWFQDRTATRTQGRASQRLIPSGELARVMFRVTADPGAPRFYVEIAYTDIAGEQMSRTQLFVRLLETPDAGHLVRGVALFVGHEERPSVAYGEGFD
jgi:hypothetical protein